MEEDIGSGKPPGWDPVGFMVFLLLMLAFGGAILVAARWILSLFKTGV